MIPAGRGVHGSDGRVVVPNSGGNQDPGCVNPVVPHKPQARRHVGLMGPGRFGEADVPECRGYGFIVVMQLQVF